MVYAIIIGLLLGSATSTYLALQMGKSKGQQPRYLKGMMLILLLGMTTLSCIVYRGYGFTNHYIAIVVSGWLLLGLSVWDLIERKIPLELLAIGCVVGTVLLVTNPNIAWYDGLLGALGIGGLLSLISHITKGAIGMGDGLLVGVLGLLLGWKLTLAILLYSTILCGVVGGGLLILRLVKPKTRMPMVPFLLIAYVLLTCL